MASQRNVGHGGVSLATLRQIVKDAHETHTWLKNVPYDVKDVGVRDMDKARAAHFAKVKKNAKFKAEFKFRSKRDPQQSIEIRGRDMVRKTGAFAALAFENLNMTENIDTNDVDTSIRFVRDRMGRFYVVVPREVERKSENQAPSRSAVALDPGVRTFQTTYDDSGFSTEWGNGNMKAIFGLCRRADKLRRAVNKSERRGERKRRLRLYDQIKNKIKEVHCKLAVWLCENYTEILIPVFESSRMVLKSKRKISSTSARNMLTWSHYSFRQLLKSKSELYPWVSVIECNEAYTSKTCGRCGELNHMLGSSKTFKCAKCAYVADRDVNGARNIMLRYLSLNCEV